MAFLLKASAGGTKFEPLAPGAHIARCVAFVDLGTQQREWQGKVMHRRKVKITWEVPAETMSDGRPFTISKTYTGSLEEKAILRADLEAWRNKAFTKAETDGWDPRQLLGKCCQISVVHEESSNGRTYANVKSVMPLGKGMTCDPQVNESIYLDLDDFDPEVFSKLSKYTQETISKSPEYANAVTGSQPRSVDLDDDEIPF